MAHDDEHKHLSIETRKEIEVVWMRNIYHEEKDS